MLDQDPPERDRNGTHTPENAVSRLLGALIAVIGAIAISWALDLGAQEHVIGAVPSGLPHAGLG